MLPVLSTLERPLAKRHAAQFVICLDSTTCVLGESGTRASVHLLAVPHASCVATCNYARWPREDAPPPMMPNPGCTLLGGGATNAPCYGHPPSSLPLRRTCRHQSLAASPVAAPPRPHTPTKQKKQEQQVQPKSGADTTEGRSRCPLQKHKTWRRGAGPEPCPRPIARSLRPVVTLTQRRRAGSALVQPPILASSLSPPVPPHTEDSNRSEKRTYGNAELGYGPLLAADAAALSIAELTTAPN